MFIPPYQSSYLMAQKGLLWPVFLIVPNNLVVSAVS